MAKRKRKVAVLEEVDYSVVEKEAEKPKCLDSKKPFCKRELCEAWYDSCKESSSDQIF